MTLDKARESLAVQVDTGSGHNRNSERLIPADVDRKLGQECVDGLIRAFCLDKFFGLQVATKING